METDPMHQILASADSLSWGIILFSKKISP
jgi:hypothetical protein